MEYTSQNIEPLFSSTFSYYMRPRTKVERTKDSIVYSKVIPSRKFQNQMIFLNYSLVGIFEEGPILRNEFITIIDLINKQLESN